ncbi:hypothetical protein C8J56DRAFT_957899, partial [Mycena floridula]
MAIPLSDCHINSLSSDVLGYIFQTGIWLEKDEHDNADFFHEFALLVSHVCHDWRVLALDLAHLWTRLYFRPGSALERCETYLERSKEAPLEIVLMTRL